MIQMTLACGDSSKSVPAESPQVPADSGALGTLWVSTDLRVWRPSDPSFIARDCQLNDRCYRRLDPDYFAWLKLRMHGVKAAADAGRVPAEAFDDLRQRFNDVQARAIEAFGERTLLDAVRAIDAEKYRPPLPEAFERVRPLDMAPLKSNPEAERLDRARALVDGIREQAIALGWTMQSLYYCEGHERRPFGARYGLVCYIGQHHRLGEVTRQSIELIGPPPMETRTRFYNQEVDQPWIRKVQP
jgi:hypothetical protein